MRSSGYFYGVIVGGAVAFAAVAALAASRHQSLDKVTTTGVPLTRPSSADEALTRFGKRNPECPMWTNWEKLCSRTGPRGNIRCSIDPGEKVLPTAPFCASGFPGNPENKSGQQLISSERFCIQHRLIHAHSATGDRDFRICTLFSPERPFNGRRMGALIHPWCEAWGDEITGRFVCSDKPMKGSSVPTCSSLAAARYEHSSRLLCMQWKAEIPCKNPEPAPSRMPAKGVVDLRGRKVPNSTPVNGVVCAD